MKNSEALVDFCYEVGALKRVPRSGWQLLGINNPETVAAHSCRTAFIAYALAQQEKANPERAALIATFHELPETRIGDLHKMATAYFPEKKSVEKKVLADQLSKLSRELSQSFHELLDGEGDDTSKEHVVAKDADHLEVIIQAREYLAQGFTGAQNWVDNATKCLRTKSAKELARAIVARRPNAWYEGIKRIKR